MRRSTRIKASKRKLESADADEPEVKLTPVKRKKGRPVKTTTKPVKQKSGKTNRKLGTVSISYSELEKFPEFLELLLHNDTAVWRRAKQKIAEEVQPVRPEVVMKKGVQTTKQGRRKKSNTLLAIIRGEYKSINSGKRSYNHPGFPSLRDGVGCEYDTSCMKLLTEAYCREIIRPMMDETEIENYATEADTAERKRDSEPVNEEDGNEKRWWEKKKVPRGIEEARALLKQVNLLIQYLFSSSATKGSGDQVSKWKNGISSALFSGLISGANKKVSIKHHFPTLRNVLMGGTTLSNAKRNKAARQEAQRSTTNRHLRNLIYVDEPLIRNFMIKTGKLIFDNKTDETLSRHRAAWAQAMVGCRAFELHYNIFEFKSYLDVAKNEMDSYEHTISEDLLGVYIRQNGVAKDERDGYISDRKVTKRILPIPKGDGTDSTLGNYTARDVVEQINILRKHEKFSEIAEEKQIPRKKWGEKISNPFHKKVIRLLRKEWPEVNKQLIRKRDGHEIGVHILRKIYLNYSYYLYGKGTDRTYFISDVGGWQGSSALATATNYTDYRIVGIPKPKGQVDKSDQDRLMILSALKYDDIMSTLDRLTKSTKSTHRRAKVAGPKNQDKKTSNPNPGTVIRNARYAQQPDVFINDVAVPLTYNTYSLTDDEKLRKIENATEALDKALAPKLASANLVSLTGFGNRFANRFMSKFRNSKN